MSNADQFRALMAGLQAAWGNVSGDDRASVPDLAALVSKARATGFPIDELVRLDALERHKRSWPAGIGHYRGVLGEEAVAPGSDLARVLLTLELGLGGRSPETLAASLDPAYGPDVRAAAQAAVPSAGGTTAGTPADSETGPHPTQRHIGERIGQYTLRKRLGRGGFGEVWLADRKDPHLRAAIKFLRPDKVDATSLARFQLEKQALALLDHPGIARILDSGVLDDGSPFAVMEFIEGEMITEYCDRNKLDVNARLELFAQVCDAIHHAHQQGFIHRDLSPDNILVTMADGKPCPKIIDFGIAKVANKNLKITEGTLTIDLKTLVGKPEYMAPEQAEAGQIGIDTRADIFALGVILYELLTGVLPLPKEELRERAIEEVLRTIRGERPEPSTRYLSLDRNSRATMSLRRGDLGPEQLSRLLTGRIRHLPMKALRLDRTKRFSSAAALATDVRNYLEDKDFVEAAAEPWRDKAFRHVKRYRLPYAAAGLILLSLVGGIIGIALEWRLADDARADAKRAQSDAESQLAAKSEAFSLLRHALSRANPLAGNPANLTIRDVLVQSAVSVAESNVPPSVKAELRYVIGDTLRELGLTVDAAAQLRAALTAIDAIGPRPTVGTPASSEPDDRQLKLLRAETLESLARSIYPDEQSWPLMNQAVDLFTKVLGPNDDRTLQAHVSLADFVSPANERSGSWAAIESQWLPTAAAIRGVDPSVLREDIERCLSTAGKLIAEGRTNEAAATIARFVEPMLMRPALGPKIPEMLLAFAEREWDHHHPDSAEACVRAAVVTADRTLAPDHGTRIRIDKEAAMLLTARQHIDDARHLFSDAVTLSTKIWGTKDDRTVALMISQVEAIARLGDSKEVLRLVQSLPESACKPTNRWPWLARCGCIDAVVCGLQNGADCREESVSGRPVLQEAIANYIGADENPLRSYSLAWPKMQAIDRLINAGCAPDLPSSTGATAAHAAASSGDLGVVEYFLAHNVNFSTADKNGWTPLHFAANSKNVQIVGVLLTSGLDANATTMDGRTPLAFACRLGAVDVVKRLLEGRADPAIADSGGGLAAHDAARSGSTELIDLLSAHGTEWDKADKDGWTPLFFAVAYGHPDFARSLVARGVVVDHRAVNGDTALHVASRNGDVGAVSVMLDAGADVNARQQDGNTPLMLAFRGKKKDRDIAGAVRTLLAHSADPKIAANNGWTALHWAVNQMSSAEVIEQLIKAGADVNAVDHAGRTPLHAVCMSGDDGLANNVRVLIRHGARTDLRDSNGKLAADYPKAGSDTARALAEAVK